MESSPTNHPTHAASFASSLGYGIKVCPICGNNFNDNGVGTKVYCNIRCRDKAKIKRMRMAATSANSIPTPHRAPSEDIVLMCPTGDDLTLHAEKIASGAITCNVVVKGIFPEWTNPFEKVIVMPHRLTPTAEPHEWTLAHERVLDL